MSRLRSPGLDSHRFSFINGALIINPSIRPAVYVQARTDGSMAARSSSLNCSSDQSVRNLLPTESIPMVSSGFVRVKNEIFRHRKQAALPVFRSNLKDAPIQLI
jgi:hypothetical protein